ncbi:MAG: SPOR domain-containing protein [Bacteroidales bacterium]|nr:SPOR domain-containing protein [Bacteroidales bacterium]
MEKTFNILKLNFLAIILIFQVSGIHLYGQDSVKVCISEEEFKLYQLVNEYRKILNLSEIPLSNSLCKVAQLHTKDLNESKPFNEDCNYHSWSGNGHWTPCCYNSSRKDMSCITEKPAELTSYPGTAFEIIYWENEGATASKAFDQWKTTGAAKEILINLREWSKIDWNALGMSINGKFAVMWIGEEFDVIPETKLCNSDKIIKNDNAISTEDIVISKATGRYYLIVASKSTVEDARSDLRRLNNEGYNQARIIFKDNKYRVSILSFPNMDEAQQAKSEHKSKYPDIWVMKF